MDSDLTYLKKILHFLSAEEIEAMINEAPRIFEPSDPRSDIEAIFARVQGDNMENETVRQLIDEVVKYIRERKRAWTTCTSASCRNSIS